MNSNWVTPANAAVDRQKAIEWISNDLLRRLMRISLDVYPEEYKGVIDFYTEKMKSSGYNVKERAQAVESGLSRYKNIKKEAINGILFEKTEDTVEQRMLKKATEKTTWFKGWTRGRKRKCQVDEKIWTPAPANGKRRKTEKKELDKMDDKLEVATVLFVDRTMNGVMANRNRKDEKAILVSRVLI